MANEEQIGKVLDILYAAFPAFKPQVRKADMLGAYTAILGDLDADVLARAAVQYAGSHTFYPSAGELRAAYFELVEFASGVLSAPEAWGEVKRAFRRGFSRLRVPGAEDWPNELIPRAIDAIGGWMALCQSDNDAADRARFVAAYETLQKRAREDVRMLPAVRQAVQQLAGAMTPQLTGARL